MKIFIQSFLLLLTFSSFGQENSKWINYTSGVTVNATVQQDSILWIATIGGLVKQNCNTGINQYYNRGNSEIPSNLVSALAIDDNGILWLSTGWGMASFDGENWSRYKGIRGPLAIDESGQICVLQADSLFFFNGSEFDAIATPECMGWMIPQGIDINKNTGDIWLTAWTYGASTIVSFIDGEWNCYNYSNSVIEHISSGLSPVLIDDNDQVWIGHAGLLYTVDADTLTIYNATDTSNFIYGVNFLEEDNNGDVWVNGNVDYNSNDQTIMVRRITSSNVDTIYLPQEFSQYSSIKSFELSTNVEDGFFIGTREKGLWYYNFNSWTKIETSETPLAFNDAFSMTFLNGKTYFVNGSPFYGLNDHIKVIEDGEWILNDSALINFTVENGAPHLLQTTSDNKLWVHNNQKVYLYDGTSFEVVPQEDILEGIDENRSLVYFAPSGDKWILELWTAHILYYDQSAWRTWNHQEHGALGGHYLSYFAHPETNEFWTGSYSGLVKFDGEQWKTFRPKEDLGLRRNHTPQIQLSPEGEVWAVNDQAILRMNADSLDIVYDQAELDGATFHSMTFDQDGNFWVGLNGAIAKREGSTWTIYDNSNSGMPNGTVTSLNFDDEQNLWITSHGGIGVFNENGLADHFLNSTEHIKSELETNPILIYPNPVRSTDNIHIQVANSFAVNKNTSLTLFDSLGRKLWTLPFLSRNQTIQSDELPKTPGTYFFKIDNGKNSHNATLIVH